MASGDAWQAGMDLIAGRRKDDSDTSTGNKLATVGSKGAPRAKPVGGLLGAVGKGFSKMYGSRAPQTAAGGTAPAPQASLESGYAPLTYKPFKRGGRVTRTGLALLHKGEYVVPAPKGRLRKGLRKRMIVKP